MNGENIYQDLKEIFFAAVNRVDPYRMIKRQLSVNNNTLSISTERETYNYDLSDFERIIVLGAGKATAKMALAMEELLGERLTEGLISVKGGHTEELSKIRTIEAGHPVPDENSVKAAREIAALARKGNEKTLFINLISGGGSALLSYPLETEKVRLTLKEKQETTKLLLASGADITEVNCIRKHISGIKGGRLAKLMYPAASVNLILSDVVGARLDSIASGLTVGDRTTYQDAFGIIEKYNLTEKVPLNVKELLKLGLEGEIEETPKPEDKLFEKVSNILIGTNLHAIIAAAKRAKALGYNTVTLSSMITGNVREAAGFYLAIAKDISREELLVKKPAAVIAGGETTVVLKGSGLGGRNQEMALWFLKGLSEDAEDTEDARNSGIYFLSAGTDGNDGPTDAAGAFASFQVMERAESINLNYEEYLENNDSYHFFEKTGFLFRTGPTNTNVCDIQVVIVV